MPADALDHMPQHGAHLDARRRLAGAQHHRHRLAALCLVDVDRQKAALGPALQPSLLTKTTVNKTD